MSVLEEAPGLGAPVDPRRDGRGGELLGLVDQLRWIDYYLNSTSHTRFNRIVHTEGYPPFLVVLFLVNLWVIWHGPALWHGVWPLLGFLVMAGAAYFLAPRFTPGRHLLRFMAALFLLSWLLVWVFGREGKEADGGLYHHALAPIIVLASVAAAFVAPLLAKIVVWRYRRSFRTRQLERDQVAAGARLPRSVDSYGQLLQTTEMFSTPVKPPVTLMAAALSFIPAVTYYARLIALLVSLAVLRLPSNEATVSSPDFVVSVIVILFFFIVGSIAGDRFRSMIDPIARYLFNGAALPVSLGVILLAVCRLLDFQYVSILLNSTPKSFVIMLLVSCYCLLWQYELWIRQALAERLLGLLNNAGTGPLVRVEYPYYANRPADEHGSQADAVEEDREKCEDPAYHTSAHSAGRFVQIHGGRLAVFGKFHDDKKKRDENCWESYGLYNFFNVLALRAFRREPLREAVIRYRLGIDLLLLYITGYLSGLAALLVLSVAATAYYFVAVREPQPAVVLDQQDMPVADDLDSVADLLFAKTPKDRVVMVAASGGGSRAALYTASVLHGLARVEALHEVNLVSGVSGGGAGLAYFGMHHKRLCRRPLDEKAWERAYTDLSSPFIGEVLRGSLETRIVGQRQLGVLLAESFERNMHAAESTTATLGTAPVGMIFNTTLCGESEWQDRWLPANAEDAGGRVVFTNIHPRGLFPRPTRGDPHTLAYRYEAITNPNVRLTQAAAANANFPPVFGNLGVAITQQRLYWVTDGGAADNRGMESLLLALKTTLAAELKRPEGKRRKPPALFLVVAEASASTLDYAHDQGWGAKMNSSTQITNQLVSELLGQIRKLYTDLKADPKTVQFHYLEMPRVYCVRGGIATHWMLPSSTTLTDPREPDAGRAKTARVTQDEIVQLLQELHPREVPPAVPNSGKDIDVVRSWVQADPHPERWKKLRDELLK